MFYMKNIYKNKHSVVIFILKITWYLSFNNKTN